MNPLYTAIATATSGRDGRAVSSDGILDVQVATPKELGGPGGATNPEQLFAAGYAACFDSAMLLVAKKMNVDTTDSSVTAEVGIGKSDDGPGFALAVTLRIELPELEPEQAKELVDRAHAVCPYSNATRGNIPVELVIE